MAETRVVASVSAGTVTTDVGGADRRSAYVPPQRHGPVRKDQLAPHPHKPANDKAVIAARLVSEMIVPIKSGAP